MVINSSGYHWRKTKIIQLRRLISYQSPFWYAFLTCLLAAGILGDEISATPIDTVQFVKYFTQGELAEHSFGQIAVTDLGSPIYINGKSFLLFGDNFAPIPWWVGNMLSGTRHPSAAIGYSDNPQNIHLTGPTLGLGPTLFDRGDYLGKPIPSQWQPQSDLPAGSIEVPDEHTTLVLTNSVANLTPVNTRFTIASLQAPWRTVPGSVEYRKGLNIAKAYSGKEWLDMPDIANTQISRSVYSNNRVYFFSAGFKRRLPARLISVAKQPGKTWTKSLIDRSNWVSVGTLNQSRIGEMDLAQLGPQEFALTYLDASRGAIMLRTASTVSGLLSAPDRVIVKDAAWPHPADSVAFPSQEGNITVAQCYGGYMAGFDPASGKLYIIISQWHTDGATNWPYRSMVFSDQL